MVMLETDQLRSLGHHDQVLYAKFGNKTLILRKVQCFM